MTRDTYDIIIIGAGVVGCAVARELSRLKARILVLEREEDVCSGTSKANSAIVHAGHDARTGTLKAAMNVRGSVLMEGLSKELDIPYRRNGAFVVCFEEENLPKLQELKSRGEKNGVKGLRIISGDEARQMDYWNLTKESKKEKILALYQSGMEKREIARIVGQSESCVRKWLKEME